MTDIERRLPKGGAHLERLTVKISEAARLTGISRTSLYRKAAAGEIIFLKCNNSTLVDFESLRAAVASLPRAVIKGA
jgi:excisionase family DNA binding protein